MAEKVKIKWGEKTKAAKFLGRAPQWFDKHLKKFEKCILPDGTYDLEAVKKAAKKKINRKYQKNRERQHEKKVKPGSNVLNQSQTDDPKTEKEVRDYLNKTVKDLSLLDEDDLRKFNELEKLLMARIKRNEAESNLILVGTAQKTIEIILSTVVNQLESLAVKTGPLLSVESDIFECQQIINKEVDFIRKQIITDLKTVQGGNYVS